MIVNSLQDAVYELLETKDISEIKAVDLVKRAEVSRGGFYKNYYLVSDILKEDIKFNCILFRTRERYQTPVKELALKNDGNHRKTA